MTYVMYKLYKHQKRVNGEWVDDTTVAPSIDANGTMNKVISFTSDVSCYNGDVTDERWVDDGIIEADCFQDFEDYDDTKQECTKCCDGVTPSVTIKNGSSNSNAVIGLIKYNNNGGTYNEEKTIKLDGSGNGYIELENDDNIVYIDAKSSLSIVEVRDCNLFRFGTVHTDVYYQEYSNMDTMIVSCSTYNDFKTKYVAFYFFGRKLIFKRLDTSNVTDMNGMFYNDVYLESIEGLSSFNTSNVTNMSYMFYGCSGLTSLDLGGWNMSNVTDTNQMFDGCTSLTSIRMIGCEQPTIDKIKAQLTADGIINNVTIVTGQTI